VLENLLNGKTDDEARDALAAENADLDTGAVLAKVRNAAIFRPLLSV
jgi:hypothetical protein